MQEKTVKLYNPLNEDFTTTYDINNDKNPVIYTLESGEIKSFPEVIANHLGSHLAKAVVGYHWLHGRKTNYEDDFKSALKEVYV